MSKLAFSPFSKVFKKKQSTQNISKLVALSDTPVWHSRSRGDTPDSEVFAVQML